jgi:tetratricopeptide (TPR) repeat protein
MNTEKMIKAARGYIDLNMPDEALEELESLPLENKDSIEYHFLKACALDIRGEPNEARKVLINSPKKFHNLDIFHINLAHFESKLKNLKSARFHIKEALSINNECIDIIRNDPKLVKLLDEL